MTELELPTKTVSIVIPTYNGKHLLQKHLPAVIACMRPTDELIIVNDCSADQTLEYLSNEYALSESDEKNVLTGTVGKSNSPVMKVISTEENVRFAGACNLGVLLASKDVIFLLNNDVSPKSNVLDFLLPYFDDAECFAVGCKEFEQNEDGEVSGRNNLWFERGRFIHSKARQMTSGETAWVSGGSGLFDKDKWILLGGFDKRFYPAYWEDIDLSFRARKKGWKVLFEEQAVVFHKHESTNLDVFGQTRIDTMSLKNGTKFLLKHVTFHQYLLYLLWKPYWFFKLSHLWF
ncbi:MAG: glycosyltransferase family 2 protein [Candidatus Pacebacteria bacterium]|nr:glycosyltransferase family 2 protein [Candidatus Paceibacterota bacterium]PIR63875.1 MAG: hypothetical protein COU64_02800 [Candidatus Pacebacteria bacterium CG10_big_fil_rev_8_21_14_0_10_40_26]PIZ78348.1 MAG: hypothetical protein COY01_06230 [Candidatus Pacebacteria bacterium CG_4_10_14_0_2_um_filter_40_20]PJA68608.1 MAG: hypothetical protein CO156_03815 [Candidatus Pacebacteria bacterium CG_4_9_14_3_um_filter_40_12]PJC41548.1 MAG: hypothetical protein CO041_02405 [Candidatus Pacebacteria b